MARYSAQATYLSSGQEVPLPGATVYVYTQAGALAALTADDASVLTNPVTSDAYGNFYFNAADGLYTLSFHYAGKEVYAKAGEQVGTGPVLPAEILAALGQSSAASIIGSHNGTVQSDITTLYSTTSSTAIIAQQAAAAAAIAAASAGAYPAAAATYLPKGLTQASVGAITAGSGGTNGTFALAWSSGNFTSNPVGTFTVAGGALTAVTITQPGLYIGASPVVPTPSFAASAGLGGGAAVVLTAVSLIPSGNGYWVQSPQGDALLHYTNVNGVATADGATGPIVLGSRSLSGPMLANETDGHSIDFTNTTEAARVVSKVAGVATQSAALSIVVDEYGTGWPVRILNSDGSRSWAPHNLFYNSETGSSPRTLTTISGETYTILINGGSGSIALSGGGAGTATVGTPLTFTASGSSVTFTKTGSPTQIQVCIGSAVTAYVVNTGGASLSQPPISYHPTLARYGLMIEPGRTNYFLNSGTPATQTISLVAGTYTVWAETASSGTITISGGPTGVVTAGTALAPGNSITFTLVGTTSVTFTKAGSLSHVQVENGSFPTSQIITYGASRDRLVNAPKEAIASMPTSVSAANTAGNPLTFYFDFAYGSETGATETIFSLGTSGSNYVNLRMLSGSPYLYRQKSADTTTNPNLLSEATIVGTPPSTTLTVNPVIRHANTRIQATMNLQNNQLFCGIDGLPLTIGNSYLAPIPTPGTYLYFGTLIASNFLTAPVYIFRYAVVPSATGAGRICSRFTQVTTNAESLNVLLTYGQSNVGNGALADPTGLDAPGHLATQYSQIGVLGPAVEPLKSPLPTTGASSPYNGVPLALVRDILAPSTSMPRRRWAILPGGPIGNTGFGDTNAWGVGNAYHNNVLSMLDSLRTYYPNTRLTDGTLGYIAMGERDAITYGMNQGTFAAYIDAAINDFRTQFGTTIPFVLGGPQPGYVASNAAAFAPIIAALADTPNRLTRTAYADPSASPAIPANGVDPPHYSASQNRGVWRDRVGQAAAIV